MNQVSRSSTSIEPQAVPASPPAGVQPRPADTDVALEIRRLNVSYREVPVLRDVSAAVVSGQKVAVIGPNGAGKSTMLKAVLQLIPVDAGEVRVFGQPIRQVRHRVAYVPQTESVDWDFPITASEVVMMGRYPLLGLFRRPGAGDRRIVQESLETVGMSAFAHRHIRQLSGGQQQRVFLARALAQQADILLLDEPFVGVDANTSATIFNLMDELKAGGKTLIVVIHDLDALRRFDSVLMLNQILTAFGPVAETATEANLYRTYGGRLSLLDRAERELKRGPSDVDHPSAGRD